MNAKMKVLSLALVGLCGYAGSALAVCPAGPAIAQGGAWSNVTQFQGTATIGTPGLVTTECDLRSVINVGAGGTAAAAVEDDSPVAEQRYRAQFTVKLDGLAAPTQNTLSTVMNSISDTTGTGITLGIFGQGGQWFLSYIVPNASDVSGIYSGATPLAAGENRVEFDLVVNASGSLKVWINNNVEATPTITSPVINNASVAGIDTTYLGLGAPTPQFVAAYAGMAAEFDQFDSRRTTFIGF